MCVFSAVCTHTHIHAHTKTPVFVNLYVWLYTHMFNYKFSSRERDHYYACMYYAWRDAHGVVREGKIWVDSGRSAVFINLTTHDVQALH